MIYFDTTKAGNSRHASGLMRVSERLRTELGAVASPTSWPGLANAVRATDWYVTAELFSEAERPGFTAFLEAKSCRTAAIFHDAIPLKHPQITWPQSVARHPSYLSLLAKFDRVWAVSAASKRELEGFWKWQGRDRPPIVEVLANGADFNRRPRVTARPRIEGGRPRLLCVGILEPRKNQAFLLDVCEPLWREGARFELHLVGRVNPHFGAPIVARVKDLARRFPGAVTWHEAVADDALNELYATARMTVFPTIAEGCGLPLLESLWMGVPCLCSDLPVLRENADAGGCLVAAANDPGAWTSALRQVLTSDALVDQLSAAAARRPLPTWAEAARILATALV